MKMWGKMRKANTLAKSATTIEVAMLLAYFCVASCALSQVELKRMLLPKKVYTKTSCTTHFLRAKATVLAQIKTGRCKLRTLQHLIGAKDSELFECGHEETVKHLFLFDYSSSNAASQTPKNCLFDGGDTPYLFFGDGIPRTEKIQPGGSTNRQRRMNIYREADL